MIEQFVPRSSPASGSETARGGFPVFLRLAGGFDETIVNPTVEDGVITYTDGPKRAFPGQDNLGTTR